MKKMITFLILVFIVSLAANPIAPHIRITEFKFTDYGWEMELFSEFFNSANLDSCYVSCSDGISYFQQGISFFEFTYFVVSHEDLQTPLMINSNEDEIEIFYTQGDGSVFNFGSLNDMVLAPDNNQSLRSVGLSLDAMVAYYVFAKDNTPSIGEQDDGEGYRGIFKGYVYDSLMNPIENVVIDHTPDCISIPDIITDDSGYFEVELYAFNYDCNIHFGTIASMDSIISIEPDIQNYYEFIFENYVSSDDNEIELPPSSYNLSNFPNPFNPSTTISFDLSSEIMENTEIQIFNSKGQKVKTISVTMSGVEGSQNSNQLTSSPSITLRMTQAGSASSITWDGKNSIGKSCPSGVYLYKLVSSGKELAVNKMLLLK